MEPTEAARYPFDYDSLGKGSFINASDLETIFGISRELAAYASRHAECCRMIEKELLSRHGLTVCARKRGPHIRILNDVEMAEEINERAAHRAKGLRRDLNLMIHVDTRELSAEQQAKHSRNLVVRGAMVAGMIAGRRQAIGTVYRRNTPGLPKPEQ